MVNFQKIVLIAALTALIPVPVVANNECRAGKVEVVILLPSGQSKTICIAESALSGLENAAEHSSGRFVTAACPCFTTADVQAMFDNNDEFDDCTDIEMTNGHILSQCTDLNSIFLITDGPVEGVKLPFGIPVIDSPSCAAKVGGDLTFSAALDASEIDSCFDILDEFPPP